MGALALGVVLMAGCGEKTPTVGVGEAPPVGFPAPSTRFSDGDTLYADTLYADTLGAAADTLRADSIASEVPPPAPSFDAFWSAFRAAVRSGRRADVAALAVVGPGGIAPAAWPAAAAAVLDEPVREALRALEARDVLRDGPVRVARAVVGYDAEGNAVPQDEAVTDSAVSLRFEIAGGAWRLVRIDVAG